MSVLIKVKQVIDRAAIALGLRNPGIRNRHDWVGPGSHEMNRKYQIDFLKRSGLLPEHVLIDLGCGTLRGGIPIIEFLKPRNYYGVDVRKSVLREARAELAESKLEYKEPIITLMKDSRDDIEKKADIIWAFHVLIHMDQERLRKAFRFVAENLKQNGRFFATATIGSENEEEWQGFPVMTRPMTFYAREARRSGLKVISLGGLEKLGYGDYVKLNSPRSSEMLIFEKAEGNIEN